MVPNNCIILKKLVTNIRLPNFFHASLCQVTKLIVLPKKNSVPKILIPKSQRWFGMCASLLFRIIHEGFGCLAKSHPTVWNHIYAVGLVNDGIGVDDADSGGCR